MQTNKDKTIVWHTSYDVVNPPKKPSENFVRFIVISDTHGTQPKVPEGVSRKKKKGGRAKIIALL